MLIWAAIGLACVLVLILFWLIFSDGLGATKSNASVSQILIGGAALVAILAWIFAWNIYSNKQSQVILSQHSFYGAHPFPNSQGNYDDPEEGLNIRRNRSR